MKRMIVTTICLISIGVQALAFQAPADSTRRGVYIPEIQKIRTPKPLSTPQINGPSVFGVRPGSTFLYRIPATGNRPMEFSADKLPVGLKINPKTGDITGSIKKRGEYTLTLHAKNDLGTDNRKFRVVVGDKISLTPALGSNSWNCWGNKVTGENILQCARAMVSSGLINHGWTYVNIDDAWQGKRGGPYKGIQGNEKFSDMKGLCDTIHALGLKVGIYSTPWVTSYANYIGGSAQNPEGVWTKPTDRRTRRTIGKYSFAKADAKQWAAWGIDYLKYDWNPNEVPETAEMEKALRASKRDIIYSLSNSMPYSNIPEIMNIANSWRTTGDIRDTWQSMSRIGFSQDKWAPFAGPGHWNDPDMLVVGNVGWGEPKPTRLTPDEQYTHISLWCLLASPLLLGCDLDKLDDFTLNLLTNDEVIAVSQDPLGKEAVSMTAVSNLRIYVKDMEDSTKAVGFFNLSEKDTVMSVRFSSIRMHGPQIVRDLWRQKDVGEFDSEFRVMVAPHGAELMRIRPNRVK